MSTKIINALLLAILTIYSTHAASEPLNIAGSTTVKNIVLDANLASIRIATGLEVKALGNGTGKGIIDLIDGKVTVSAASESLADALASAKKAAEDSGKKYNEPAGIQFHLLKLDSLVVIVNKASSIDELSKEQLKNIFTGKFKNWKDVGGADKPIKIVTSEAGSGTRAVFQKQIMDNADYDKEATVSPNARAELFGVSKDKDSIGAVSEEIYWNSQGSAKVLKTPAINRPLGLITIGKPNPEVQKLIDFFKSDAGKKLLN